MADHIFDLCRAQMGVDRHQRHAATGEGVAFHLIGALSEFGKLGLVAIGKTPERAEALYRRTMQVLDSAAG